MSKRFPAFFLALALCLGLAVPAFAADTDNSATLYTWISEDFPYVNTNLEYQARSVDDDYKLADAEELSGSFELVPASEYFRVGVYNLAEGEQGGIAIMAYSDPDGDGVYDQRLFQTEKNAEGAITGVSVLPLPKDGAYKTTGDVIGYAHAIVISGFGKVGNGDYAIGADRLYELFGDNTLIWFRSAADQRVLGAVMLSAGAFDDVPGLGWYSGTVAWAADQGIAMGGGDGSFEPGAPCTHIQILTFLSRAAGNTSFGDYDWNTEQEMVMKWASEKGMIGEEFDAGKSCTRAEAVNYIWQAFDKPSAAASDFKDVDKNADYAKAVDWAAEKRVSLGSGDGIFDPGKVCNRAEIVTFLYRAYKN